MDISSYYTQQSFITNPGEYAPMFADLPRDIAGLCRVVQGLVIHYRGGELFDYTIPDERLSEIDTRYVPRMLARIAELDSRPLTEARPPEKRLVGCCRDFSTLFCAMARHQGIPTRVRIGFAGYFIPGFYCDHEIVERWDAGEQRWRLVDPEMSNLHIKENKIQFDVLNVPRDQFLVAGLARQMCLRNQADPDKFGVDPGSDIKGSWFINHKLVQDLAALNKIELLLWDCWGLMLKETLSDEDQALLDKIAVLTQMDNDAFSEQQVTYEHESALKMPSVVMNFSPIAKPSEVTLAM